MSQLQNSFKKARNHLDAIKADVTALESGKDNSASVQGRISANFASLDRQLQNINDLVKREIMPDKRDDGMKRFQAMNDERASLKRSLEQLKKKEAQKEQQAAERDQLLAPATPAYGSTASTTTQISSAQDYQVRIETSINNSINQVDQYLGMGTAALDKLKDQGNMLKSAHRRMLDIANTLGISNTTIRWIERRTNEDKYIFWTGVVITLIIMYYSLRWAYGSASIEVPAPHEEPK